MTPFLRRQLRGLTRNPHYKLLSFLIAVVAWLYVQGEQVVEAKVRAGVDWVLPQGLTPVEPLPSAVTLTVGGPRNATRKAARLDPRLLIDLSDVTVGEHSLEFSEFPVTGLPSRLDLLGCAPSAIRFVLDEVGARKVKIVAQLVGEVDPAVRVSHTEVTPSVVTVRGPRERVDELVTVNTLPVDVSGLDASRDQRVELDLPRGVDLVSDAVIRIAIGVSPRFVTERIEDAPVLLVGANGWQIEPDTVTVVLRGPAAAMESVRADEVVVFAHLPDGADRDRYQLRLGPTEGARLSVVQGGGPEVTAVEIEPKTVRVSQ